MKKWGVGLTFLLGQPALWQRIFSFLTFHMIQRRIVRTVQQGIQRPLETANWRNVVIRQSHGGSGKQATSVITVLKLMLSRWLWPMTWTQLRTRAD